MKILVTCVLLSTLGFTFATPLLKNSLASEESDEVEALLQTLANTDGGEELANLQGVFNVLEQVNIEKARASDGENAMEQIWGLVGSGLWHVGKHYLKKKYCSEEQEINVVLQATDRDEEAITELQSIFAALKKAKAKTMLYGAIYNNKAKSEGWWKKVRRWAGKKIGGATRKYLC